jgi:hypothetical protein
MTKKLILKGHDLSITSHRLSAVVIAAALGWTCVGASAQERTNTQKSIEVSARASSFADLEKAFWICDHAATTSGVDGGAAIACGAITEDLKMRKFSGDFDLMLVWWRKNKVAEHQALATAGHAVSRR